MGVIRYKDIAYGGGSSVTEGYYKVADGKFYEHYDGTTYSDEITGEDGILYIDLSTNNLYRWSTGASLFVLVGKSTLASLNDTNIATPTNGQILSYDGTNSKWVNSAKPTDTMVKQNDATGNSDRRVLLSYSASDTNETNEVRKSNKLIFNPSTGKLKVENVNGTHLYEVVTMPQTASPVEAGWRRVCKLSASGYATGTMTFYGGFSTGAPTNAVVAFATTNNNADMVVVSNARTSGTVKNARIVQADSASQFWLDVYVGAVSSGTFAEQSVLISGNVVVSDVQNSSTIITETVTERANVSFDVKPSGTVITTEDVGGEISLTGNPITFTDGSESYASELTVEIKPIQSGSGTPSPSNVRHISGISTAEVETTNGTDTNTASITLGRTVYNGTIDFLTGQCIIDKEIIDLGDMSWTYQSQYTRFRGSGSSIKTASSRTLNIVCDSYQTIDDGRGSSSVPDASIYNINTTYIGVNDSRYTDATLFKNAVTGVKAVYPLATPTTLILSPAELKLLQGNNTVTTNGYSISMKYQPQNLLGDVLESAEEYADRNIKGWQYYETITGSFYDRSYDKAISDNAKEVMFIARIGVNGDYVATTIAAEMLGTVRLYAGTSYLQLSKTKVNASDATFGVLTIYVR